MKSLLFSGTGRFSLALTAAVLLGLCPLQGATKSAAKPDREPEEIRTERAVSKLGDAPSAMEHRGFAALWESSWIARDVTLAELGFPQPIVVGAAETQREVYLPVPANLRIYRPVLHFNADYMRADGGRTALVLMTDNEPISSRNFASEHGDAGAIVPVNGSPRSADSIRLSVIWKSILTDDWICADGRSTGNFLRVDPTTHFSFVFNGDDVRDLSAAWGALPHRPVILVAREMSAGAYDSAWRIGAALTKGGKNASVRSLPAVGEQIDLGELVVPDDLKSVAAFAALANGGSYKIKNLAEVGALLALGQNGTLRPDLMVVEPALIAEMTAAADALEAELRSSAPQALAAFARWRDKNVNAVQLLADNELRLIRLLGRPVIGLAPDAGAKAAGLYEALWRPIVLTPKVFAKAADKPVSLDEIVTLGELGAKRSTLDVLARSDWTLGFDLGAVSGDGRIPTTLELDISAAPGATATKPVASVFMNDILLGAMRMEAPGKRERITVMVPRYALLSQNVLRVSFIRQLASYRCNETPEAYPASILPSSHFILTRDRMEADFSGMTARFGASSQVLVPQGYLSRSAATLPRVIRLATTTGVSPIKAGFAAVPPGSEPVRPDGPFLSFDLPLKDMLDKTKVEADQLVVTGPGARALLDLKGLDHIGVVEVLSAGDLYGVSYRAIGDHQPPFDRAIKLTAADIAVIGPEGLLVEFASQDPSGRRLIAEAAEPIWRRNLWWVAPIIGGAVFIAVLILASRYRRRKNELSV